MTKEEGLKKVKDLVTVLVSNYLHIKNPNITRPKRDEILLTHFSRH